MGFWSSIGSMNSSFAADVPSNSQPSTQQKQANKPKASKGGGAK